MASRSTGGGTILASGIRTRERKERKLYSDDWALGDEEIEGHHTFDLEQKIKTDKFDSCFVKDMTDHEYTLAHVQKNGFNWPLLFKDKSKLGITIPSSDFTINDVRLCVGSRRMLDVMDVNTQKNVEMTMKDWQRYFDSQDKDKLLNVISLEFSHTKLESLVQAPTVVRQVDWVERVWPRHLKEAQTEATNVLEDMMYPKVQKYCLMSVRGCYTDFHIDFGGTSVWYHVLRGRKIFWLIPPTERNLQLYEQWVLSGKQSDIFFGDTVEKCARIELKHGSTFFIPTGWIHAVYTPEDSLVFGGNFLHSFGIEKQLRVAQVEDATHVPQKFRYPFFTEMLWYVLERYVHVLLGRTHLTLPPDEQQKYERYLASKKKNNNNNKVKGEDEESDGGEDGPEEHIHLTQYELHGLKAIVMYLHALPTSKKCVPELITDPIALIRDVRTVVEKHRYDSPELSTTSRPVLEWWPRESTKFGVKRPLGDPTAGATKRRRRNSDENKVVRLPPNAAKIRHRRVRCKYCESCLRDDCRQCGFCMDMVKYGGPGTMKQTCKMKKCTQPMLPVTAVCYECQLDGWGRMIATPPHKPPPNVPSGLFECCICYKISHLKCLSNKYEDADGIVNEDLPNSWECPECVKEGYNKEYKHNRVPSSRTSTAGSDTGDIKTPQVLSEAEEDVKVKLETLENGGGKSFDPKKDMSPVKVKQEMRVAAAFVWAVAGAAWALEEGGVGSLYDQHFPPLHPNCTQSLTDLLLLRQESQLRESAGILKEILSEIKGSLARTAPSTEASCSGTFLKFGGTCLYLAKDVKKTWDAARTFCQDLGGDLAVFRDANALAEAIGYAKALGIPRNNNVWVGGTDRAAEGKWKWVSGEDMPRGTPFWGIYNDIRQPNTGRGENCALLFGNDGFLIHDGQCGWTGIPLCQTKPT